MHRGTPEDVEESSPDNIVDSLSDSTYGTMYDVDLSFVCCSKESMQHSLMIRLIIDHTVDRQFIKSMSQLSYNSVFGATSHQTAAGDLSNGAFCMTAGAHQTGPQVESSC